MPNWVKGSLKFRGPYENILKFFEEGINIYRNVIMDPDIQLPVPKEDWLDIHEYGEPGSRICDVFINSAKLSNDWAYIEETKRAFIFTEQIYIQIEERSDMSAICVTEVAQAWDFRAENWEDVAKTYGIDVRLYGYESGGQFGRDICIEHGRLLKNEYIKYDDWEWECPFPWIGG